MTSDKLISPPSLGLRMQILNFIMNLFLKQQRWKECPRENNSKTTKVWKNVLQTRLGGGFWAGYVITHKIYLVWWSFKCKYIKSRVNWIDMKDLILFEWGSSFPKIVEFRAKMRTFLRYFHVIVHQFPILTITIHIEWKISECPFLSNPKTNFRAKPFRRKCVSPGAIIRHRDHKRARFLVLGLAKWYGIIFLFLEQIAPSPAAHARSCCEDFCGCRAGEVASEIQEILYAFGPQLNTFMFVGIWLKYFRRKLLQLSEVRQCRI